MGITVENQYLSGNVYGNSLTLNRPAGVQVGDTMLAHVFINVGGATITPQAGWTTIRGGGTPALGVFLHVATASEPTSYTFSFSGSQYSQGAIQNFRGVDTSQPQDVTANQNTATGTTPASLATTTQTANDLLAWFCLFPGGGTLAMPAGTTSQYNFVLFYGMGLATVALPSPGAVSAQDGVLSVSQNWQVTEVMLKPSVQGGSPIGSLGLLHVGR